MSFRDHVIAALLAIAVMAASLMISHAPGETPANVAVATDQDRR
ncbi:MAG TPA: hypothetical protein VIT01_20045 [Acidimicrobiales bacterium]|jgi:hypothetical protein